jgi:hypothetical protein
MAGLYRILEKVGHSYRLDLPQSIRVHPVFSPDKLQKASNNPLLRQRNNPPLPIQVNGEDEWEVDEILASKTIQGSLYYRASWKGVTAPARFTIAHVAFGHLTSLSLAPLVFKGLRPLSSFLPQLDLFVYRPPIYH